jgi:hypothetical protein
MRKVAVTFTAFILNFASASTAQKREDGNKNAQSNSARSIASQPAKDIGAVRQDIPPVLLSASSNPYSRASTRTCKEIKRNIAELDDVLGPDFDVGADRNENRLGKVAEAGGKTIVNSIIPFRGLVREITGAAPAQRRLNTGIDAGFARRGFLRGAAISRGCRL